VREIAIFRQNLFRISEPFIAQQVGQLRRYKPFYVGRMRFGEPPEDAVSLTLQDRGGWGAWPEIGWQMVTRSATPYLRLLGSRRPALIHAHFGTDAVYALPLARRLGVPLITTFHGFDATLSTASLLLSPAWANYPLFRHQLAQQGDLFLCVSSFIRERVLAMGFPEARTRVHYIGEDYRAIQPRSPQEETRTILHVARLVEMKGTKYLIRGFAELSRRWQDVQLVIIGDGPMRASLQALTRSLGLEERVQFLGARPHGEVLAWMRRALMLVLPSILTRSGRTEGLGMVLLEAAATGVPVVGSRIGGIPEVVVDGQTGFLVPDRDPDALASRMLCLLEEPTRRRRMGEDARAHVERYFDVHAQTKVLEELYDRVLEKSR
jgi:glycosyltransferase involved in cell wall biosynthesis